MREHWAERESSSLVSIMDCHPFYSTALGLLTSPWSSLSPCLRQMATAVPAISAMLSHRILTVGTVLTIVLILLVLSTSVDHNTVIPKLGNAFCQENDHSSTPSNFFNLFESTRHPISAKTYRDASGEEFRIAPDGPWWHKPLKDEVLILDIDTRAPQGP